mmetsp:Transcript_22642/g.55885  ORF Transcript_22642/g.55885 Transcript_22642/m.55885 type:complete len:279 (+) Transcript_22642:85-921(+)
MRSGLSPSSALLLALLAGSGAESLSLLSPTIAMQRRGARSPSPKPKLEGLRGGWGGEEKGVEESNQTGEAISFFNSERVPAVLIAGAALSVLFAFPISHGEDLSLGFAKRLYITLCCSAFCNELICVFSSSLAIARLLTKKHNPMAQNAAEMMLREYPLYFMAVRTHFLTGLLCFAGSLSIRMWAEYHTGCWRFARAMLLLLGATCAFMLSLFNTSLTHFSSLGDLWVKYVTTIFRTLQDKGAGPVAIIACLMFAWSAYEIVFILGHMGYASMMAKTA